MLKNKEPMRTCIGCKAIRPKKEMIRVAYYEGQLSIDKTGKAKGRGVYLCNDEKCINTAVKKKAFQRSFKTSFTEEVLNKVVNELTENDKES